MKCKCLKFRSEHTRQCLADKDKIIKAELIDNKVKDYLERALKLGVKKFNLVYKPGIVGSEANMSNGQNNKLIVEIAKMIQKETL